MKGQWHPSGWPIVDAGLLMAAIDDVMFVRLEPTISEPGYARHLIELARAIDGRNPGVRVGVLYDAMGGADSDARRRQRAAEVLAARREKLAATTAGFTLATESTVMRGVARAVFWLAPPPYPWAVTASVREGLVYLRTQMPNLDVDGVLREYDTLRARLTARPSGIPRTSVPRA